MQQVSPLSVRYSQSMFQHGWGSTLVSTRSLLPVSPFHLTSLLDIDFHTQQKPMGFIHSALAFDTHCPQVMYLLRRLSPAIKPDRTTYKLIAEWCVSFCSISCNGSLIVLCGSLLLIMS
ncbi:hypothetical protein BDV96DRAFT_577630 [Lophiotrema nucula]|uniref:Uncharacterized protein n=1 Tax=Lophiotrema nucula TaxID=690887 RepID=A0A6A5Z6V7_9PLEO|nr:hypothetical protein BDV96DRAFT_577630 [Lophiotrema nucula]